MMKGQGILLAVLLFYLGLVSSCGRAAPEPSPPASPPETATPGVAPAATPVPSPARTARPEPSATLPPTETLVEPTTGPAAPPERRSVSYEGIHFAYEAAIARGVTPTTVPAAEFEIMPAELIPAHVEFLFAGYLLPHTFHEPRIFVYPVDDFEAGSATAAQRIAALAQLLAERPATPGQLPFLPLTSGGLMLRTQVRYLNFQNGTGLRFLAQGGQAYRPANNYELFYSFQGLTDDGRFYVAAIFPVSHPMLPPLAPQPPDDAFIAEPERFLRETEQQLDDEAGAAFTPDLDKLDALIQTLAVDPATPDPQPTESR